MWACGSMNRVPAAAGIGRPASVASSRWVPFAPQRASLVLQQGQMSSARPRTGSALSLPGSAMEGSSRSWFDELVANIRNDFQDFILIEALGKRLHCAGGATEDHREQARILLDLRVDVLVGDEARAHTAPAGRQVAGLAVEDIEPLALGQRVGLVVIRILAGLVELDDRRGEGLARLRLHVERRAVEHMAKNNVLG